FKKKQKINHMEKQEKKEFCQELNNIFHDIVYWNEEKRSNGNENWINSKIPFILPPDRKKNSNIYSDVKSNPQRYLPCMIYMMKFIEEENDKLFSNENEEIDLTKEKRILLN